jgi:hypothetical protein
MSYAGTIAADAPVLWYRLTEQGAGFSRNRGTDPQHLYTFSGAPIVGFTGIASDGGSLSFAGASRLVASPQTIITANSGFSVEGWVFAMSGIPFGGNVNDIPLQLFVNSATGAQLGMNDSSLKGFVRDPSATTENVTAPSAVAAGWHHLVATRPSGATPVLNLYVDGVLVGSTAPYSGFGVNEPCQFRLQGTPTAVGLFVAEPAVYYYELSGAQVAAHHAAMETTFGPLFINRLNGVCT